MNSANSKKTILFVEDERFFNNTVSSFFNTPESPYHVISADSRKQALKIVNQEPCDLAVINFGQSDGSGLEIIRHSGKTPCIFLMHNRDIYLAVEAMKCGAADVAIIEPDGSHIQLLDEMINRVFINGDSVWDRRYDSMKIENLAASRTEEKMALLKNEFFSSVSHELRTPLNGVIGFAQTIKRLLDKGDLETERLKNLVNYIIEAGNHLTYLIESILDLSTMDSGNAGAAEKRKTSLRDLHEAVLENQAEQAVRKGLEFNVDFNDDLPDVKADLKRLSQVLKILINNAIEFSDSGKIQVKARLAADKKKVTLSVVDTGRGIHQDVIHRVFDPFVKDERQYPSKGPGLGLALAREIVEQMDGDITVKSRPGHGSTFSIDLKVWQSQYN